ncbi:MAG: PTS sugar transporter subunit IIA [Candidatus Ancaeobacter aquaticus]|nr:PTS sugar transporter subunit IIA [Candidatus Ancaeobacter aquaticus]
MSGFQRSFHLVHISKMLKKNRVHDIVATKKEDVLREMVDVLARAPEINDADVLCEGILEREQTLSTGIGIGIAVPHARTNTVDDYVIAVGRKRGGLLFDAVDGGLVYLVFMIAGPDAYYERYLNIHAKIMFLMTNADFRTKLINAGTSLDIYNLLKGK